MHFSFDSVYMTIVGLPYVAWVSALQALPESRELLLIIGDIISIIPQVAFQRGLGAVIEISSVKDDPTLSWGDVWKFETRVWFTILLMTIVGTFEWVYLYRLTTTREPKTKLSADEIPKVGTPVDTSSNPDIVAECNRSKADDEGINARELVKVFRIKPSKESKSKEPILKRAVKGVSYGVRKNEIFALLGPNGKSCDCEMTCSTLNSLPSPLQFNHVSHRCRKDCYYEYAGWTICSRVWGGGAGRGESHR